MGNVSNRCETQVGNGTKMSDQDCQMEVKIIIKPTIFLYQLNYLSYLLLNVHICVESIDVSKMQVKILTRKQIVNVMT